MVSSDRAGIGLRSERGPLLLAMMLSTGLVAIDSTVIATAVQSIVAGIGGFAQFPCLFSVYMYMLASAVTVPVSAKLAETIGRRPIVMFGIGVFLLRPARSLARHLLHQHSPLHRGGLDDLDPFKEKFDRRVHRIDYAGATLLTVALTLLILGVLRGQDYGWTSGPTLGVLGAGVALLVVFAFVERRAAEPVLLLVAAPSMPRQAPSLAAPQTRETIAELG